MDRATAQTDDFLTPASAVDDEQLTYAYRPSGELLSRVLRKGGAGAWVEEQSSTRSYFDNGLLRTLVNKDGAGATLESHALAYIAGGVFANGNRVSDVFQLKGPDAAAPCYGATCTASWTYDARERLTQEVDGTGKTTSFTLDVQGNVTSEATTGQSPITRTYSGQLLQTQTHGATAQRFVYDALGNVDCTTTASYQGTACPAAGSTSLLEDFVLDYKSRLVGYRLYDGAASASKTVDTAFDRLDRPDGSLATRRAAARACGRPAGRRVGCCGAGRSLRRPRR